MAIKDRAALTTQAEQIRTETTSGANTATRVGQMLVDIVDSNQNKVSDIIPELQTQAGSTIVFTAYNEYNAASPLTSGDITIDPTNAIAGAYASVYFNGATEPNILGGTGQLISGSFTSGALNIYHFFWNTNGQYVLNIQSGTPLPQLSTPSMSSVAGDTLIDLTFSNIDSNATTNVLERSTDNINFSIVGGYNGTDLTYQDTGLINGTEYFYRYKSQAVGYQDSNYDTTQNTPEAAPAFDFGNALYYVSGGRWVTPTSGEQTTGSGDFTLSYWIKYASIGSNVANFYTSNPSRLFQVNNQSFNAQSGGTSHVFNHISNLLQANVRTHIVLERTSGDLRFYINGNESDTGAIDATGVDFSWTDILRGASDVEITEVGWKLGQGATAQNVTDLYNSANGANFESIMGAATLYYQMNESTGLTASDSSSNNDDGILNSGFDPDADAQWILSTP